jgi:hypothetical protein
MDPSYVRIARSFIRAPAAVLPPCAVCMSRAGARRRRRRETKDARGWMYDFRCSAILSTRAARAAFLGRLERCVPRGDYAKILTADRPAPQRGGVAPRGSSRHSGFRIPRTFHCCSLTHSALRCCAVESDQTPSPSATNAGKVGASSI